LNQFPNSKPLLDFKGKQNAVDELVCFQEAQTLPLFLVKLKGNPTFTPAKEKPPFNLVTVTQPPPSSTSQTVASSSSATTFTSSMTRAAFEKLKTQALIDYLISQGIDLEEEDVAIFKKQRINGEALAVLSQEALERYGLPGGLVALIMKRIPKE